MVGYGVMLDIGAVNVNPHIYLAQLRKSWTLAWTMTFAVNAEITAPHNRIERNRRSENLSGGGIDKGCGLYLP